MGVFDELREAFRQAVENFKTELNRDSAGQAVDGLLSEMRQETIDAESYLRRLRSDLDTARQLARKEATEASTCRRREELARSIGDEETAGIAGEFAQKHESRSAVLQGKVEALQAELTLREEEVADMKARLKKAMTERDALSALAGRARSRDVLGDSDLFDALDRMEERIDDERRHAEAVEELDRDGDSGDTADPFPDDGESHDLDERLEILKRKLRESKTGREDDRGGK